MNFIHPLVSMSGVTLTEDTPADHPHHRGVFWAWRRVMIGGESVGDAWIGRDLSYRSEPPLAVVREDGCVEIATAIVWNSTRSTPALPFMQERARIVVQPDRDNRRSIDIEVRLRALLEHVTIAGTDDDKGYGGPSIRFAHTDALKMESDGRALTPQLGAVETGASVDFSWQPRPERFPERVNVACLIDGRPWTRWVLRRGASMQNCAFPGREPVAVPMESDLVMHVSISILS